MHSVEGGERVFVQIDATGCVTRTAIAQSSGAPELDRAGMSMAFAMEFVPGEVDGKAIVIDRFILPITFSVKDAEPPVGAGQPPP
jgi:TonB family protein